MPLATIQLRVDQHLRDDAQAVCHRLGMDLTTAIRVFLNQLVVDNGLPFQPRADPFFAPSNPQHPKRLQDDDTAGRSMADLDLTRD